MASTQDKDAEAREKRAATKEELVFLTSGAKEKFDKTLAGMKGAGHILTHPFSKEAREEATARTAEEKNKVEAKQASIRAAAHQQAELERAAAGGGVHPTPEDVHLVPGAEQWNAAEPLDTSSSLQQPGEQETTGSYETFGEGSSSSSDESGRARAKIFPSSVDYRSG